MRPVKKRGPKPIGSEAMTPAERQRRRRELLRQKGSKSYLLTLSGLHQQYVEAQAAASGLGEAKTLQLLLETAMDRYVCVMHQAQKLEQLGASDAAIKAFVETHLSPSVPDMNALKDYLQER